MRVKVKARANGVKNLCVMEEENTDIIYLVGTFIIVTFSVDPRQKFGASFVGTVFVHKYTVVTTVHLTNE